MYRTKKIITTSILFLLMALSMLVSMFFLSGCESSEEDTKAPTKELHIVDYGFTSEELVVPKHSLVTPETPLVLLDNGECVRVLYEVLDAKGNYVQTITGSFLAEQTDGYTIAYKFLFGEEIIDTKEIKVIVKDVRLSVDYDDFIEVGKQTVIQTNYSAGENMTYEVTCNGEEVPVTGNTFVATQIGIHNVVVSLKQDGVTDTFTYETCARLPNLKGEIETFGEDYELVAEQSGIVRDGWERVTTETAFLEHGENAGKTLKDRYGLNGSFLAFTTSGDPTDTEGNKWPKFRLNIRNDIQYYRNLIDEGYEYLSMWVYLDSEYDHANEMYGEITQNNGDYGVRGYDATGWQLANSNPKLSANKWTELKLGLYPSALGRRGEKISFLTAFDYLSQGNPFLCVENSEYNASEYGFGGIEPGKMTIYIADIMAVRPVDDGGTYNKADGEFDIRDYIDADNKLYVGEEYTFELYMDGHRVEELPLGENTLLIRVYKNGDFYEARQLNLTVIDTANPTPLFATAMSNVHFLAYGKRVDNQLSIVDNPLGKEGAYYKATFSNADEADASIMNKGPGFRAKLLDKDSLQRYSNGIVRFEVYNGEEGSECCTQIKLINTKSNGNDYTDNAEYAVTVNLRVGWNTIHISVETLLQYYDLMETYFGKNEVHNGKLFKLVIDNTDKRERTIYFGNFTIYPNEIIEPSVDLEDLVE